MEDIDQPRCRQGSAEKILDDLRRLGLDWDEGPDMGGPRGPYVQSERLELYQEALDRLSSQDLVFPCWCSRKDVERASSAPHRGEQIRVYPGTCRHLDEEARTRVQAQKVGRTPSYRFRVGDEVVEMEDVVYGPLRQDLGKEVGDFVLKRADGLFAYQLAVVVDDALMGVTEVLRGVDLMDSSPRQHVLFRALGFEPPSFWHVPLVMDETGRRMSKRDGSDSLDALLAAGWTVPALVGRAASSLGLVAPGTMLSAQDLLERLDLKRFREKLILAAQSPLDSLPTEAQTYGPESGSGHLLEERDV